MMEGMEDLEVTMMEGGEDLEISCNGGPGRYEIGRRWRARKIRKVPAIRQDEAAIDRSEYAEIYFI